MKTSMEGYSRQREINHWDKELNGLLSLFAKLPEQERAIMLQEVAKLRKECEDNTELLIAKLKIMGSMYGLLENAIEEYRETSSKKALTATIGQILEAAEKQETVN